MRRRWKRFRYRLEWIGLRLALKLVPLLPRSICLRLARVLGFLMSIFDRQARNVALANLEVAFGNQLSWTSVEHLRLHVSADTESVKKANSIKSSRIAGSRIWRHD